MSDSGLDQVAQDLAKNNDVNKPAGAPPAADPVAVAVSAATGKPMAPTLTGNPMTDLFNAIQAAGDKLIADLQAALALATYQLPGGGPADPIAAAAITALIPLAQLVIDGPPAAAATAAAPAGTPGILTEGEKLRIIAITVQSTAFKQAVSPFIVDTVQQIQGLINGLTTLFTGGAIAGLVAMPKIPIIP